MGERSNVVGSVAKALDILEILSHKRSAGITELARSLEVSKSTAFRILATLKAKGYVTQDQVTRQYMNSFKLFEMGNNVVKDMGLRKQAFPYLKELADKTGEAVNLAVLEGGSVVYIDKMESTSTIRADLNIGKRMPLYCTGLGKVFLAFLPEELARDILEKEDFKRYTPFTHQGVESLLSELREIRRDGFALDNEEYVEGLLCIAAPVWGFNDEVVAALSVAMPKYVYWDNREKMEMIRKNLMDASRSLSSDLRGTKE
ncbi:MAG TPA: IclR family transcriptional regulator [Synergistales bacterium]|nr:IclR family transcriptional regulator [Synergistales bacterium]